MGQAISQVLPFAIGIAISPVPIIAVILVLFTPRAKVNGLAFLAGWSGGLTILTVIVYAVASSAGVSDSDSSASDTSHTIKLVLGIVLILLAARDWRKRPAPGQEAPAPKWMAALDSFTPVKAAGMAALLSSVNPKNLALAIGAATSLAQLGTSGPDVTVAIIVFVLLASVTIAGPVIVFLAGGDRAASVLDGWKAWLSANNAAVMAVLFLVFGVVLFSEGLGTLS
jgi:threonine/homoserine/homoserine lactone efflux protein